MAERTGKPWSELLEEALHKVVLESEEAGSRLREILDSLSEPVRGAAPEELDSLTDEAAEDATHGKA